jgi:hypothetical protein
MLKLQNCVKKSNFVKQQTKKRYAKYYLTIILSMNIMKSAFKLIVVAVVFVFSIITLLPVYGQEITTKNSITDLIKTTAEKIKDMASEVANNSTGIISPSEAKNILNQLGEAAKKTALGGTDVLSNFTGEIREGLK